MKQPVKKLKRLSMMAGIFLLTSCGGGDGETPVAVAVKAQPTAIAPPVNYARELSREFARVSREVTPAVVQISAIKNAPRRAQKEEPAEKSEGKESATPEKGDSEKDSGIPFQDPREFGLQGQGTGVIVDNDGHILTNFHVVVDADEVLVQTSDKSSYKAGILGRDPRSDLAVLEIKDADFLAAKLGDSDKLEIGEWVVAMGNPFGLGQTITAGIVSAKGRSIIGGQQFEDFIQTDAAINPGNSGGPLVNLDGEVVGINTAIFSRSGGYMGIGFAIPINMAKEVMRKLILEGKIIRGSLGVLMGDLNPFIARSLGYHEKDGAIVLDVEKDGPSGGKLEKRDIIVEYNGQHIVDFKQLRDAIAASKPGSQASVGFVRKGQRMTTEIKLGELSADDHKSGHEEKGPAAENLLPKAGLKAVPATKEQREKLQIEDNKGVAVRSVEAGSAADRAGLREGDLIMEADGKAITGVEDLQSAVTKQGLRLGVKLLVKSKEGPREAVLKE
jgi:serine protease Do